MTPAQYELIANFDSADACAKQLCAESVSDTDRRMLVDQLQHDLKEARRLQAATCAELAQRIVVLELRTARLRGALKGAGNAFNTAATKRPALAEILRDLGGTFVSEADAEPMDVDVSEQLIAGVRRG